MPKEDAIAINYTLVKLFEPFFFFISISFDLIEWKKKSIQRIPNEYYISPLTESHSEAINDTWHFKDDRTLDYIKSIIRLNGASGLFERNSNKLISWILLNENMSPGCLYTIESARRHGFGKLLMQCFCKQLAIGENVDVLVYANADNTESISLFRKIGFQILNECFWYRTR